MERRSRSQPHVESLFKLHDKLREEVRKAQNALRIRQTGIETRIKAGMGLRMPDELANLVAKAKRIGVQNSDLVWLGALRQIRLSPRDRLSILLSGKLPEEVIFNAYKLKGQRQDLADSNNALNRASGKSLY